ncbi:MAG: SGNH/GDSL hydrolase family protein [bacterium]|nr:SGNH/GDSL hydrolase family protein [bacterium]
MIFSQIKDIYKEKGIYYLFLAGLKMAGLIESKHLNNDDKLHNFCWFLYSKLSGRPLVHAIGDSHTLIFKRKYPFIAHHIGAATAYNLKKEKSTTDSNKKFFAVLDKINKERDAVLLSFGEIDCRIHMYNEYMKNNGKFTMAELINNTIINYGDVLDQIGAMGVNFFVLGIPAASRREDAPGVQFYADPKMRSRINGEFNEKLKKFCEEKNYRYIDIYSEVSDEKGFISEKYVADHTHVNDKAVKIVREFLKNRLNNNHLHCA